MRPLLNTTVFLLDADHGYIKLPLCEEVIGPAENILQQLAAEAVIQIKAIASVGDVILNCSCKGGTYTVWGQVPGVIISGGYRLIENGTVLSPDFWTALHSNKLKLSLPWTAPETMQLYFLSVFDRPNAFFRHQQSYIIAGTSLKDYRGWFRAPLANLYDDGHICMGRTPVDNGRTLAEGWDKAFNHFAKSEYNTDLSNDVNQSNIAALVRFDAATNKQLPVPVDWPRYCSRVNSTIYNCIL